MPAWKEKQWCLWTTEICQNIKICPLNVKDPKNIISKMFFYLITKNNQKSPKWDFDRRSYPMGPKNSIFNFVLCIIICI
jgi:hypothetical protein